MKKFVFFSIFMLACLASKAQDSLKTYNYNRNQITATGMTVLGSWGLANLGVGAIGWANSQGGQNKYFYQMTTIWGGINLALGVSGFVNAHRGENETLNAIETLKQQEKIEKIFLVNGGLDLVYLGAGAFLNHRGIENNNPQLKGYGTSIIAQGAFLLLFDATMYSTERHNGNKLRRFLEKNPIGFTGKGIGIMVSL
jgi:hypothetical protein